MANLLEVARIVAGTQQRMVEIQGLLLARYKRQQLRPIDIGYYDILRNKLYMLEMEGFGTWSQHLQDILRIVGLPDEAKNIPMPRMFPAFPLPPNDPLYVKNPPPANQNATLSGFGGLGNPGAAPVVVVGSGFSWMTALVVVCIALAAVAAVVAAIYVTGQYFSDSVATEAWAGRFTEYLLEQQSVSTSCLQRGFTPAQCAVMLAATKPPPPPKGLGEEKKDPTPLYIAAGVCFVSAGLLFWGVLRPGGVSGGGGGGGTRTIIIPGG